MRKSSSQFFPGNWRDIFYNFNCTSRKLLWVWTQVIENSKKTYFSEQNLSTFRSIKIKYSSFRYIARPWKYSQWKIQHSEIVVCYETRHAQKLSFGVWKIDYRQKKLRWLIAHFKKTQLNLYSQKKQKILYNVVHKLYFFVVPDTHKDFLKLSKNESRFHSKTFPWFSR